MSLHKLNTDGGKSPEISIKFSRKNCTKETAAEMVLAFHSRVRAAGSTCGINKRICKIMSFRFAAIKPYHQIPARVLAHYTNVRQAEEHRRVLSTS